MPDEIKPPINLPNQPVMFNAINMIYANGTTINISQSDIQLAFSINGKPIIGVAMTLPVAKHLQKSLDTAIKNYETKTGIIIGDLIELGEKLKNK